MSLAKKSFFLLIFAVGSIFFFVLFLQQLLIIPQFEQLEAERVNHQITVLLSNIQKLENDLLAKTQSATHSSDTLLPPQSVLTNLSKEQPCVTGFYSHHTTPVLMATCLEEDSSGNSAFAYTTISQPFDSSFIQKWSKQHVMHFHLTPLNALPQEHQIIDPTILSTQKAITQTVSDSIVQAQLLLTDIEGHNSLLLLTCIPKTISSTGQFLNLNILIYLTLFILFISLLSFFILKKAVFKPIKNLTAYMEKIDGSFFTSNLPELHRNDEIGQLYTQFERMLYRLGHAVQEMQEAQRNANHLAKVAEQANKSKSQFLANMSHEIRTPMNAVLGFTQLMEKEITDPDQLESLKLIHSNAQELLKLLNEILDLSKIEAGHLQLHVSPIRIVDTMQEIVDTYRPLAKQAGLNLRLSMNPNIPTVIAVDSLRLRQIVGNLLNNALKFTHKGEIHIAVQSRSMINKNIHKFRISITDTGIGIPEKMQKTIFKAFRQGHHPGRGSYAGTGLGLTICAEILRIMDGDICLESKEGEGSTFLIEFPVQALDHKQVPPKKLPHFQDIQLTGLRILIVDDIPMNTMLLEHLLQNRGAVLHTVHSGKEALQMHETQDYDIILLDIGMPDIDGISCTKSIRKREAKGKKNTVIIAVTAHAMADERENILSCGVNAIVTKPVLEEDLLLCISREFSQVAALHLPNPNI